MKQQRTDETQQSFNTGGGGRGGSVQPQRRLQGGSLRLRQVLPLLQQRLAVQAVPPGTPLCPQQRRVRRLRLATGYDFKNN